MSIWADLLKAGAAGLGVGIGVVLTLEFVRIVRNYLEKRNGHSK